MSDSKPIRVVGVISSPRFNGNTAILVRQALEGAREAGATVSEIFLPRYEIRFCQGCLQCLAQGRCPMQDDLEEIRRQLQEADGIILGSPTYVMAPNAIMKNLLDRLGMFEYLTSSALGGKYIAGISAAANPSMANKVARGLMNMGASGVFSRGYGSGFLGAKGTGEGVAGQPAVQRKARALGAKLVHGARAGRRYLLQNLAGRAMNRWILRPRFETFIMDNREDTLKGVYQNLSSRGLLSAA